MEDDREPGVDESLLAVVAYDRPPGERLGPVDVGERERQGALLSQSLRTLDTLGILEPSGAIRLGERKAGKAGRGKAARERKAGTGESGTGAESGKAGRVHYWQYGQAEKSPDLAISDLSRFPELQVQQTLRHLAVPPLMHPRHAVDAFHQAAGTPHSTQYLANPPS